MSKRDNIIEVGAESFDQAIAEHALVVVDFWAPWCVPCKAFATVIDRVAAQHPDVMFLTVDIDKEPALAEEFEVRSVPSVMILRDRVVVFADSGALGESALTELLQQAAAIDPIELKKNIAES